MATFFDYFMTFYFPYQFMFTSATYIPSTIYNLIARGEFNALFSPSAFKNSWFANFWGVVGSQVRTGASIRAGPLIAQAHGVVLDIGPGSGEWLKNFDKSKVSRILGVEPNRDHHAALQRRITEAALDGIYEIVPVGVEDLGERWVKREEVDSVCTILCLCSVDEPKRMMDELYGYLKEGGTWIVFEHVKVFDHQGSVMRWYQAVLNTFWPIFIGGCNLTRDTDRWLKEVGKWTKIDLHEPEGQLETTVLPHTTGTLTK